MRCQGTYSQFIFSYDFARGLKMKCYLIVSFLLAIVPVIGILSMMFITDSSYYALLEIADMYGYVPFWLTLLIYSPIIGVFQFVLVLNFNFLYGDNGNNDYYEYEYEYQTPMSRKKN